MQAPMIWCVVFIPVGSRPADRSAFQSPDPVGVGVVVAVVAGVDTGLVAGGFGVTVAMRVVVGVSGGFGVVATGRWVTGALRGATGGL